MLSFNKVHLPSAKPIFITFLIKQPKRTCARAEGKNVIVSQLWKEWSAAM